MGLTQALTYTDVMAAACADLAQSPQRAQPCDHIRPGYRRSSVGKHVIYFRVTDYGIAIIRILHQRMDSTRRL
jgi:toxin ParE1/3/4